MVLVPDLMPTLTTAPGFQPYSARGFCWVLNSSMASIGSIVPASPAAMTAFMTLCAIQGSLLLIPSTMKKLSWGRRPFELCVQPELPTYFVTPGRRSSKFSKFRPFKGRSLMTSFCNVPPSSALVVSTRGTCSVTVIVCACSPGWSERSTRSSWPTSSTMFWRSVVLKPLNSARTLYAPGIRFGALYAPDSSVVRGREVPLWTSKMVTAAPVIAPPFASVTVPTMRPELPCENAGTQIRSTPNITPKTCRAFLLMFDCTTHLVIDSENFICSTPFPQRVMPKDTCVPIFPPHLHRQRLR